MLINFFEFGTFIFWAYLAVLFLFVVFSSETPAVILCLVGAAALYLFSDIENHIPNWKLFVAYFAVGLLYWFARFNTDLLRLKSRINRFAKQTDLAYRDVYDLLTNGAKTINDKLVTDHVLTFDSRADSNLVRDLLREPSAETFFYRFLIWPIDIIKDILGNLPKFIWDSIYDFCVFYKNKMLGIQ